MLLPMNMHTLRRRYGHAVSELNAQSFADELKRHMHLAGRHASVRVSPMRLVANQSDDVYVNFVNLPDEPGVRRDGAESENNRASFWIRGFGHGGAVSGKVKVEQSNSVFSSKGYKLRARSGPPLLPAVRH